MNTYKNVTDQELVVSGVGVVAAGGTIETEQKIENPNLQLQIYQPVAPVATPPPAPVAPPAPAETVVTPPITPNS